MKQITLIILGSLMLISTACEKVTGDGPVVTETRIPGNFSALDIRVDADVQFVQSPNYDLTISAQRNILDVLETYVSNNRLVIKFRNDVNVRSHRQVVISIAAPTVNSIRLSGSGNLETTGALNPADIDITVSGSGNINIQQLNTGDVDAFISGSGSIFVVSGSASRKKLSVSGSGNMDLAGVAATEATTFTSGSGNIKLNASQKLNVTISGSGNVYYKGNPAINSTISGSGKIIQF